MDRTNFIIMQDGQVIGNKSGTLTTAVLLSRLLVKFIQIAAVDNTVA